MWERVHHPESHFHWSHHQAIHFCTLSNLRVPRSTGRGTITTYCSTRYLNIHYISILYHSIRSVGPWFDLQLRTLCRAAAIASNQRSFQEGRSNRVGRGKDDQHMLKFFNPKLVTIGAVVPPVGWTVRDPELKCHWAFLAMQFLKSLAGMFQDTTSCNFGPGQTEWHVWFPFYLLKYFHCTAQPPEIFILQVLRGRWTILSGTIGLRTNGRWTYTYSSRYPPWRARGCPLHHWKWDFLPWICAQWGLKWGKSIFFSSTKTRNDQSLLQIGLRQSKALAYDRSSDHWEIRHHCHTEAPWEIPAARTQLVWIQTMLSPCKGFTVLIPWSLPCWNERSWVV